MVDLSDAVWRKSSRRGGDGGDCVEVALNLSSVVAVRDSKSRNGGMLVFGRDEWRAFVDGVRAGDFRSP
ncbi:hypothetical protein GCM10010172_50580 [Paractinoplanes ferrugineus]|uniref:DUF397 domain-containing protein n=1 Tax=Paractinoplanes ferrugineus TaxID=113564 RepID=A0A919JA90_9ACTN|nr:DUF397 domain-containing protein [Actinoplanes ferrugineus]GIE16379.1 hypothetical protein Afe05nite_82190 [Actinoplanes ferrugineus]